MDTYVVLYRHIDALPLQEPLGFVCLAEDSDHAEEQCLDAEDDIDILWVAMFPDCKLVDLAKEDWWST